MNLFPYQELNVNRSEVWMLPYKEKVPSVEEEQAGRMNQSPIVLKAAEQRLAVGVVVER